VQTLSIVTLTGFLSLSLVSTVNAESQGPFRVLSLDHQSLAPSTTRARSVPEVVLTERNGKPMNLAELRGKIWIADFIYTQCTDTCPLQTAEMAKLQELWTNDRDLRLVSISVDPERDTPKMLTRYAARFHADRQRWLFLTGDKNQIVRLVEDGFNVPMSAARSGHPGTPIVVHSPRFILVDRNLQIRGSYDSRDRLSMQRLKTDVANALKESVHGRESDQFVGTSGDR